MPPPPPKKHTATSSSTSLFIQLSFMSCASLRLRILHPYSLIYSGMRFHPLNVNLTRPAWFLYTQFITSWQYYKRDISRFLSENVLAESGYGTSSVIVFLGLLPSPPTSKEMIGPSVESAQWWLAAALLFVLRSHNVDIKACLGLITCRAAGTASQVLARQERARYTIVPAFHFSDQKEIGVSQMVESFEEVTCRISLVEGVCALCLYSGYKIFWQIKLRKLL